jgi:hypothetical protein
VDWFEVTTEGNWLQLDASEEPKPVVAFSNGDLYFERAKYDKNPDLWATTQHYKFKYTIYLHAEEVGTIITHPRNSNMGQTGGEGTRALSQLRLSNHVLYSSGWIDKLTFILDAMKVRLNNVTRIDIAVDGFGFVDDYKRLLSGQYRKLGRAKMQTFHKSDGTPEGFTIGSRSSGKFVRCYNKSKELKIHPKSYIERIWERAGLVQYPVVDDVERLELQLRAEAIAQIKDFDIYRLDNAAYLAGIMKAHMEKFYQFVERSQYESTGNISRCKRINAVDWAAFAAEKVEREEKVDKPSVLWSLKQKVRFDMLEYYAKLDKADNLFNQIFAFNYELCRAYGITDWFESKLPYWQKRRDFHQMMIAERRRRGLDLICHFK